jgi:transcription initiation factor TFIIB
MSASTDACPECDGRLRAESTETVCSECGLVVEEDTIDRGPEWRSFADDDTNPERTGAPLTRSRHDRGLSTESGRSTRVKGRKRRRLSRMRRQHTRARIPTKADRNQVYSFTEIRRLTSQLGLPEHIRDRACVLFESAQEANLLQGRSLEGFAAATVYAACRSAEVARTLGEVTAVAKADEGELKAAYGALNRELGLPTGPVDPREYLARFATRLELSNDVERRARGLVGVAAEAGLVAGRNPGGVAAGCLYAAAREAGSDRTQGEMADVAGVTPVTVRKTYHDLREEASLSV